MPKDYYSALYKKVPGKWVVLSAFGPDSNIPVRVEDIAQAIEQRASEVEQSLYATFAVFDKPPSKGRGKAEDISAIGGVFLDIDSAVDGKYAEEKNPPMTLDEVKALLLGFGLPEPSAIVSSGRGYHFDYWLLNPFIIENDEDRARAKRFLKSFNGYAIQKASEVGIKLDNMGDLARVKRGAGSKNYRPNEPVRPAVILELHPDRAYDLEALEAFKPSPVSRRREKELVAKDSAPQWKLIAENEPFIMYCIANATTLPYGHWFAALGIAARCENGRQVAHDFSRLDSVRYSEAETDEKIDEVLKAAGAVTYTHIINDLGFVAAAEHRFAARLHSPLDFGRLDPEVLHLVQENVFDLASGRYYDNETLTPTLRDSFEMKHGHRLADPHKSFKQSELAIKASRADYLPDEERIVGKGDNPVLNLYQAPKIEPVEGSCDTILAHFDYLIPDAADREHVLNYIAHMRQHPGIKIKSALLFVGPQGNGKSLIFDILTSILGSTNVKVLTSDVIENRFKAGWTNLVLLVFEELMGVDKRASNSLKQWITSDEIEVEEKGTKFFLARAPRGTMFTSNHVDAIILEDKERRFAAIQTAEFVQSDAYYLALVDALPRELPAFAHWLDQKPITAFNPQAHAPQTALKTEIQKRSLSPLAAEVKEAMDDGEGVFAQAVGTAEQVVDYMVNHRGWTRTRPTAGTMGNVLYELGARNIGERRLKGIGKKRLWAFRDVERWKHASVEELSDEYRPGNPFGLGNNVVALRKIAA
ncbi:primase-helicase family protein [Brevundimonas sp.]|uniref:primase-helicase family protein n=1 Tax=Brevundimonas sp. TaxID=1871086 RepID=UPI003567A240